ncbi:ABC transporter ATP-binding protein [Halorussus sp. MSC15.2]|uniref:ABC transporter ATP-binding protein n=1 Tax=Halorussus sp. MSC15.2 TaxID=2283638 RepID=UPI0013D7A639|nr:ABC transporter ATP-binding protein [Halorussus sp. MSC15.2]NEU57011.1 ABC transporter ATP-binding protein [Halorussus sp. MSC15.2]
MPSIETHGLTKCFGGDVVAVDDLNLAVDSGEVFGFLGPNGAGKSTTIDMILDFVRPTSGEITVLGHDPQTNPRAVRERIGVLPEATGFYDQDTARDHLRFAIAMKRTNDDPDTLLERVGIADAGDRSVGGFSKGMRKRLGLAIALVGSPDLLVLDEPLGGLDPSGARLLRDVVREERDRGAAVFFSSHIMNQVETVCDRVGIMHDGHLVAVDTVKSLYSSSATPATVSILVETVPEGVTDELAALRGVSEATIQKESILVRCTDPAAKTDAIARLDEKGVPILDVDTEMPSLEDVFLTITNDSDAKGADRT